MKRPAENEDSSDDELFLYSNKQKLTFSNAIELDDIQGYSSSSDSSEDDEENSNCDVVVLADEDNVESKQNKTGFRFIPPDVLAISPSPPPPIPIIKKPRTSSQNRRDSAVDKITINLLKTQYKPSDSLLQAEDEVDDDIYVIEEKSDLRLKIRVHGFVEKYDVKRTAPLMKLIEDIAKKENVVPGHVTLNWGNASIDPDETVNSLGLTVADIIECFIHEDEVEKENTISIKIQSANNKSDVYDVKLSETVERVLKDFCAKHDAADILKVRFSFDGERIDNLKTTFSELDTMDGDVIDADLKS